MCAQVIPAAPWVLEEAGGAISFHIRRRTIVSTLEVVLQPYISPKETPPSGREDAGEEERGYVLWAVVKACRDRLSADGAYSAAPPFALTAFNVCLPHCARAGTTESLYVVSVPLRRWELEAGSRVMVVLAPRHATPAEVAALVQAARTHSIAAAGHDASSKAAPATSSPYSHDDLPFASVTLRLSGLSIGVPHGLLPIEWKPLFFRRWLELKSSVREATVVEHPPPLPPTSVRADPKGEDPSKWRMFQGDVKEARAMSVNGHFVYWLDGSVGIMDELKTFSRTYTPARQEKLVRVRRFPHRHADVVGHVPHGCALEAIGRATDPFTGEQYALVLVPHDLPGLQHLVSTYDLSSAGEDCYVWGWSKIAGSSGLPLLVETQQATCSDVASFPARTTARASGDGGGQKGGAAAQLCGAEAGVEVLALPAGSYFTSVRDGKGVRIRKKPSLQSEAVGTLETNEVREAIAIVRVPIGSASSEDAAPCVHEFVQWSEDRYSLMRNHLQTFLAPVNIQRESRRFPVRSRPAFASDSDDDVVDLDAARKIRRVGSATSTAGEKRHAARRSHSSDGRYSPDASLLSPTAVPADLREAIKSGKVRAENLPAIESHSPSSSSYEDEEFF